MSNGFWGNMWISCFFIATFHQIVVYSLCLGRSWLLIHLMLEFISEVVKYNQSIFCISIHLMLKFILFSRHMLRLLPHFKTSHVKVYPQQSSWATVPDTNFKTSHVKVYPPWTQSQLRRFYNFKTSHVKVYPSTESTCWAAWQISKHLMLKFIKNGEFAEKYLKQISKHLMLKFISIRGAGRMWPGQISKHLMLKFIISTVDDLKTVFNDFKTSHVKVYHRRQSQIRGAVEFQNISC